MRELIRFADPESVGTFPYFATDPADLLRWRAGPVTALGDAVHPMPPTGGRGAATAIRDADYLTCHLHRAERSKTTVPLAVHACQQEIAEYSAAAVRDSLQPLK